MSARIGVLAMFMTIGLGSLAVAQDDYAGTNRGSRARRPSAKTATTSPAAATTGVQAGVQKLPPPPHPNDLVAAPGQLTALGPVPASLSPEPIALVGATVHSVAGEDLEGATVLISGGRITAIGKAIAVPADHRRFDLAGRHLYPSLILSRSILGLVEIGAVRATRDFNEVGDFNPNVRAEVGVNPNSEILPVTRSNGILIALTSPSGGLVSGTSAVIALDGWTWEDMVIKAPAMLAVDWPNMELDRSPDARTPLDQQERQRDDRIQMLRDAVRTARAYAEARDSGLSRDRDVKWESMIAAARGEIPVLIEADSVIEIKAAIAFAKAEGLRLVIEGGRDAWQVAALIAREHVPLIYSHVMSVPREWEPFDVNYSAPKKLYEAGVEFSIGATGDGASAHARGLPYDAAMAVAHGLPADRGLRAITLDAARILGVSDRLGSIEVGKDATLIVTDGDPLDIRSNVHWAFVRGAEIDLSDRHKRLYERQRLRPRAAVTR